MKTLTSTEIAMTTGPFLRLLMLFRERQAKVRVEARYRIDRRVALAGNGYPTEPDISAPQLRSDRMALGPFLTLILTLNGRHAYRISNRQPTASAGSHAWRGHPSQDEDSTASFSCRAVDVLEASAKVPPLGSARTHHGSGIIAMATVAQRKISR
jgi:hypothetical protein